ncbi:MAG: IPT/TIG domain-containing protein [Planctomycetota bacterium]
MRNTFLLLLAALLVPSTGALAQTIDTVRPACGTEGDRILIAGSGFGDPPVVSFDGIDAEVLRHHESRVLVRVPEGISVGEVTLDVDGATATFVTLEPGSPVVLHLSPKKATAGMRVLVIGLRLGSSQVDFVDADGAVVDTVRLFGRRHIGFFRIPDDLAAGAYTLVITNAAGLDTGPCSPKIQVVEAGLPTLDAIRPPEQPPGRPVVCEGTDLGPFGPARVAWTDIDGKTLRTFAFSNGFDRVYTRVPPDAVGGATYDVVIELRDGSSTEATGVLAYRVGLPPGPTITAIQPEKGPAGSVVKIRGKGFVAGFGRPVVEFGRDGVATEAKVLLVWPGFGLHEDVIVAQVPDVADGDYRVTVTVGDRTSNAVAFTVGSLPLTVTSMKPAGQGPRGPTRPVVIEGTGFGVFHLDPPSLAVTWDGGTGGEALRGFVLFHTDRVIVVIPPGGRIDPLPTGTYTVRVVVDPDGDSPRSVEAGTYTVE